MEYSKSMRDETKCALFTSHIHPSVSVHSHNQHSSKEKDVQITQGGIIWERFMRVSQWVKWMEGECTAELWMSLVLVCGSWGGPPKKENNFPFLKILMQPLWRLLKKQKIDLPYDPVIPFLGIYLDKAITRKDTCIAMLTAALQEPWHGNKPKRPAADE